MFGKPLEKVALTPEEGLPRVVVECIAYLSKSCLDLVGIFRVPGSQTEVRHIRELYDQGTSMGLIQRLLNCCRKIRGF